MFFYSTNKQSPKVNFEKALIDGLAPDGGLYFPEEFPKLTKKEIEDLKGKNLQEIGFRILKKWLGEEIEDKEIRNICKKSLDFQIPLKKLNKIYILEIFHGPTLASKDVAAKTLANIMDYFLKKRNKKALILVATSGDTGGAVAQGFSGVKNVKVVVLFPKGKVSRLQEEQLTRVSGNVIPVEIDGVFDDCQALVKTAFNDSDLKNLNLSSANSINIGRLIPQIIYYVYVFSLLKTNNIEFIVPSGNMGNITAGLFAAKMGMPFNSFICATNVNKSVLNYYRTGVYKPEKTISTLSNAMDVGNPSNFVRILELFNNNYLEFKKLVKVISVDDKKTIESIKNVYKKYNYLLDPHTAVGYSALKSTNSYCRILISTASPVKFAREIKNVTGIKINDKEIINTLKKANKKKFRIKNNYQELKNFLVKISKKIK